MKPPLDTDLHLPAVLTREQAVERLLELLAVGDADRVWDEIIGALYDARAMSAGWRQGSCIRCSVPHPESPRLGGRPWLGHRMICPKYVGPLEHRVINGHQALMGWSNDCQCGRSYLVEDAWAEPRQQCPDAALDWRGPRPETETT